MYKKYTKFDTANMDMAFITAELSYCQRRKVLRLIRKFNRECEYIKSVHGFSYVIYKSPPYKYIA